MDHAAECKLVDKAVAELGEHFDTIQILVTRHASGDEGGTVNISIGVGNWFARYGQAKEWCLKAEERTRKQIQQESDEP